jgi:uncharacterized protein with von Willebrand factor type A (vWA) domain
MATRADPIGTHLWSQIERFCAELRRRGLDIAVTEVLDAAQGVAQIDIGSRAELRAALRCTLVKRPHHGPIFDEVFDRLFPSRPAPRAERRADALVSAGAEPVVHLPETTEADDLGSGELDLTVASDQDLRFLADELVERHGGFDEAARTEKYHVYRVLRAADLAALMEASLRNAAAGDEPVDRRELDRRLETLRRLIVESVRAHLADIAPDDRVLGGREADPFDIALAEATSAQLDDMRVAIRPLARKLAARLRHRRQSQRRGRLDMRATTRRSLSSGGVPLSPAYRRPKSHKPDVTVLCDVSGSVADMAGFTLTLISALADELSRTRLYAFVDAVDDITDLIAASEFAIEPWQLLQHGKVIGADGHSDYGTVLHTFWERYGRTGLSPRSTVIIVGDARGNYRSDRAEVLAQIAGRVRAVYWLNPEPRSQWDTTDSVQATYATHCAGVYEVRTINQLTRAVEDIL